MKSWFLKKQDYSANLSGTIVLLVSALLCYNRLEHIVASQICFDAFVNKLSTKIRTSCVIALYLYSVRAPEEKGYNKLVEWKSKLHIFVAGTIARSNSLKYM